MLFPLSAPRCRLLTIGTIIGGAILVLAASINYHLRCQHS
ncbi:hypothetical protein HMPREF9997_02394 [Corynebacterium durum F0235]|uniref:Uncharacterized protein n=1 Tax=Corynebacterium durum F0235 TaxID=1035195 RepID=L1MAQ3_9CORY|nr:hypothetical protein HMPREF9997_02394 [Corynebacterium durum F0235]